MLWVSSGSPTDLTGLPHLQLAVAGRQAYLEWLGQLLYLPMWFFIRGFLVVWWSQDPREQRTDCNLSQGLALESCHVTATAFPWFKCVMRPDQLQCMGKWTPPLDEGIAKNVSTLSVPEYVMIMQLMLLRLCRCR